MSFQALLDIAAAYASKWRYQFDAIKSFVLVTTFRLYSAICLPILLYGCEFWCLSHSHLLLLECVHCKILCSIQGLPVQCPVAAVLGLLGAHSVASLIWQCQLNFIFSFSSLKLDALLHCGFAFRLDSHGSKFVLSV